MIVLIVADVVQVCALVGLAIVDHRLGDIVAQGYDVASEVDREEVSVDGTYFA